MKLKILASLMSPFNFWLCCSVLILILLVTFSIANLLRAIHEPLEEHSL